MHKAVEDFIKGLQETYPRLKEIKKVLEFGSYNINGTPRSFFPWVEKEDWIGLDWRPGPGVDVAIRTDCYQKEEFQADLIISTEMLEHDPYWRASLYTMCRSLDHGGFLILTFAIDPRAPHELDCSPVPGHYQNMDPKDIQEWIGAFLEKRIRNSVLEIDKNAGDGRIFMEIRPAWNKS